MNNAPDYENNLAFAPETEQDLINKAVNDCMTANIKLLEENKKLKEQIKEANNLLVWVARSSWSCNQEEDDFDRYLKKWGVLK